MLAAATLEIVGGTLSTLLTVTVTGLATPTLPAASLAWALSVCEAFVALVVSQLTR